MIKKTFEKVNECLYYEKLKCGLEVFLYPTNKTKNFYLSISVKYGARVNKYKINNEIIDVIPGSAHFLEHKVMALSENPKISKRINDLGNLANAWTNYFGTNYNIFGSMKIKENLKLLLDIFYNIDINEKCVNEEKGIIGEEIDMYKDQIDSLLFSKMYSNLFYNSYVNNTVVGEREDIEKITAKGLNKIYNDYYAPNNTFIIVTGEFDPEEIMCIIKDYVSNLKLKEKLLPTRIKSCDKPGVKVKFEEYQKDLNNVKVKYALKISRKLFKIKDNTILRYYLGILLSNNFSSTSSIFEKYKNSGIIFNMNATSAIVDDYVVISISASCKNGDIFIKNIKEDIKNMSITKGEFERKKKQLLKSYILDFDNIEDIEYDICLSILYDNKVNYNEYSYINDMSYEEIVNIINSIDYENVSIIKTIK